MKRKQRTGGQKTKGEAHDERWSAGANGNLEARGMNAPCTCSFYVSVSVCVVLSRGCLANL